jgi:hypothetical protein
MNELNKNIIEIYTRTGIMELSRLEEESVFEFQHVGDEPENPDKIPYQVKASDVLSLKLQEEDVGANLFILPAEFYNEEFSEKIESYRQNANIGNFYLEHCFTLPNINLLNAEELKAIRNRLRQPGTPFRMATDEWITLCHNNAEKEQRVRYFNASLLPSVAALQLAITNNEILNYCQNLRNFKSEIKIFIGELPVKLIWDFYKHFGAIHDSTWQALEQQGLPDCGSWPVMILSLQKPVDNTVPESNDETVEPVSIKKSILIT